MTIDGNTRLAELTARFPFLLEALTVFNPRLAGLASPALAGLIGKDPQLKRVAKLGALPLAELLDFIAGTVRQQSGETLDVAATGAMLSREEQQAVLKTLIRDLHRGADRDEIKQRFEALIDEVSPGEIGALEQALIDEGMPALEIRRLCDVHLQLFEEAGGLGGTPDAPPGHPVQSYIAENAKFKPRALRLRELAATLGSPPDEVHYVMVSAELGTLIDELALLDLHYQRKEHQLFPYLEKHGISGPPKVMWAIHDEVRALLKELRRAKTMTDLPALCAAAEKLAGEALGLIEKEQNILLPMALELLSEAEWIEMRRGESEIGYALIPAPAAWPVGGATESASRFPSIPSTYGLLDLDTGQLTPEQVNLVFSHLPVELSFVDEHDEVRFFSRGGERIFARTPAVIGRKVENCHPAKSVHLVQRIVEAFRNGERDSAEFWLTLDKRFVHIRYFAVRDAAGAYRGTLEVVQDITAISELSGEQRLLDWK